MKIQKISTQNFSSNLFDELKTPTALNYPIICSSLSEYACISLLEKYTDWKAIDGVTFQISIGKCKFDFLIGDRIVEYHPITLKREFLTKELSNILSEIKPLNKKSKELIMESLVKEFKAQYIKRRIQAINANPKYSSNKLLCVHTPEEFVEKVVIPNCNIPNLVASKLVKEFENLRRENKRLI